MTSTHRQPRPAGGRSLRRRVGQHRTGGLSGHAADAMTAASRVIVVRLLTAGLTAVAIAGCVTTPDYVLVNRTETLVAISPGVVLAPCSDMTISTEKLRTAGNELVELTLADDWSWVPAGAVVLTVGVPGRRIGSTLPLSFIITSTSRPVTVEGPVPASEYPPCEGAPFS